MGIKFCKHYQGMFDRDQCDVGVKFSTLQDYGTKEFKHSCPCFGPEKKGSCDHKIYPTKEEMQEAAERIKEVFKNTDIARSAIVEYCGGPWKRGMKTINGCIDCPICKSENSLEFSRSGYNGHIHARCKIVDCVSWME